VVVQIEEAEAELVVIEQLLVIQSLLMEQELQLQLVEVQLNLEILRVELLINQVIILYYLILLLQEVVMAHGLVVHLQYHKEFLLKVDLVDLVVVEYLIVEIITHQKDQVILPQQVHHKVMLVEKDVIYQIVQVVVAVDLQLLEQTQEVIMVALVVLVLQTI